MNNRIILPSGNTTPALHEQKQYLELLHQKWATDRKFWKDRHTIYRTEKRIRKWNISTSGESAFRQNGTYKEKQINEKEQSRRDWRKRKGFQRDQAKGRCFCKCKITDTQAGHRAWARDLIKKGIIHNDTYFMEEYAERLLSYNKDQFTSRWDCC